ncbi:MAG: FxsA family protein [Egibacteraceae bacterium]
MPVALLLVAFIVVPLVEIFVIVGVADGIGWPPTLLILFVVSIAGAWLVRREGRAAWRSFRRALDEARMPAAEVVDGALVLVGGALLLTPGFVTDTLGLLLVLPPSRAVANRMIRRRTRRAFGLGRPGWSRPTGPRRGVDRSVDVEVVNVERNRAEQEHPRPNG